MFLMFITVHNSWTLH